MNKYNDEDRMIRDLFETIKSRIGGDPAKSYTAKLFGKGRSEICKKFGEEAVEVIIAALKGQKKHVVDESCDVLYHLSVLWVELGIEPSDIFEELKNRATCSGIEEKKRRVKS